MAKIGLPEIIENREQTIEELRQALADIVTSCFYLNGNDGAINSSWMDEINLAEKVQPGTAKIMREILAAKDSAV